MRTNLRSVLVWLLAACAACSADEASRDASVLDDAGPAIRLRDFSDGPWTLRVDRTLIAGHGQMGLPTDALQEFDYEPSSSTPSYALVVSSEHTRVSIGTVPWLGERTEVDDEHITYDFVQGAFAGGRFIVWQGTTGLQAELTLYGSGLPIIKSERGELTRLQR